MVIFNDFSYHNVFEGYLQVSRYVKTKYGRAREDYAFHRLLIKNKSGNQIDHINRNKLDNRRENLRLVRRSYNLQNRNKFKHSVSNYVGVTFDCKKNVKKPWISRITKDRKRIYLGSFKTELEAAMAYDEKALEIYGENCFLNFSK